VEGATNVEGIVRMEEEQVEQFEQALSEVQTELQDIVVVCWCYVVFFGENSSRRANMVVGRRGCVCKRRNRRKLSGGARLNSGVLREIGFFSSFFLWVGYCLTARIFLFRSRRFGSQVCPVFRSETKG
jgi:hypothetical protein